MNESGLEPVGHAILLLPYQPDYDRARSVGILIPDEDMRLSSLMVEMRGVVVALGPLCYRNEQHSWLRQLFTPFRPRCKVGDKVLYSKFSGALVHGTMDGKMYRMVNDQDVFVKIVNEAEKPVFNH